MNKDFNKTQKQIEFNKKHGLLCACNETLIPYYNEAGEEHGTKILNGRLHGYDDCRPVEETP